MKYLLSAEKIRNLGFEWPNTSIIENHVVIENGKVNLNQSLNNLRVSQAYYEEQINAAFNFKSQTGADYSDFTDKFDDYVRMKRMLGQAILYLENIIDSVAKEKSDES